MRHSRLERRGKNLALPIIGQLQMRKKVLKSAHWASRLDLDAPKAETSKRHKSKRPYSFLRLFSILEAGKLHLAKKVFANCCTHQGKTLRLLEKSREDPPLTLTLQIARTHTHTTNMWIYVLMLVQRRRPFASNPSLLTFFPFAACFWCVHEKRIA